MNDLNYGITQINFKRYYDHRLIAKNVLGRELKKDEIVHHIDTDKYNNINNNLCICSKSFHVFLHHNMLALKACGNKNYRKCVFCHKYDSLHNMSIANRGYYHKVCRAEYNKTYKKKYYSEHPRDYKQEYKNRKKENKT